MTKRMQWKSVLAVIAALVVTPGTISTVLADASGRTGYSGNPATRSGATCSSCHSGGPATTVTLSGPTSVAPNSTNAYTVTVTSAGQTGGGFDVSTTAGTLAAGTGSKLSAAEVIQSNSKNMTGGAVSWQFNWTAPASGTATLYASGLSTNNNGGTSGDMTAKTSRVITVASTTNVPPVARPAGPYTGTAGQAVSFSGATSSDSDGTIASYAWSFGDSTTGTGATATHSYAAAGTYTVTLTVTDNGGATGTATTTATIAQAANVLPVARPGGPYTGTPGVAVSLSGASSTDSDGTIANYAWNFGDSTTGTGATATHSYAAAGTYT
ncbi:MAG: PKD domain-containing protein, partial [Victivallales bacterium]